MVHNTCSRMSGTARSQLSRGAGCAPSMIQSDAACAGGGGGGGDAFTLIGGGGGAGGLIYTQSYAVTPGVRYTVIVGQGGQPGQPGRASSISSGPSDLLKALGGGAGSTYGRDNPFANGGSGGGEAFNSTAGMGTAGQGNNGGRSTTPFGHAAGGGGGAAGAGGDTSQREDVPAGAGGLGVVLKVTGTPMCYAGGGGGGSVGSPVAEGGCEDGSGMGGSGSINGLSGAANTGGGGGGGGGSSSLPGSGGSGIVALQYCAPCTPPPSQVISFTDVGVKCCCVVKCLPYHDIECRHVGLSVYTACRLSTHLLVHNPHT
jgi:hypothetical protein